MESLKVQQKKEMTSSSKLYSCIYYSKSFNLASYSGHLMSVLIVPLNFCLCFAFTGINIRGMLHHVCDVDQLEPANGRAQND